jgi:signal transduction histidine kinase
MTPPAGPGAAGTRWHERLRHSLRMRLVALFVVLGLAMSAAFVFGMQRAFSGGWRELVRPLLSDYVDRLAAEIGNPPDPERARALAEHLPIWLRVRGPLQNFDTRGEHGPPDDENGWPQPHPDELTRLRPGLATSSAASTVPAAASGEPPTWNPLPDARRPAPGREHHHPPPWQLREPRGRGPWLLTRVSSDGHVLQVGLDMVDFERRPRAIGWATLSAILLLTLGAYAYIHHLLRPLADIGAGAQRYGRGDFATPIVLRRNDELGELAAQVNTMARDIHAMLDAKRALLLAISHELRSPLTRARLNAELVDEGPARDALLHDLAAMRDLITDLLESERLAGGHSALQVEATDLGALLRGLAADQFDARTVALDLPAELAPLPLDPPRLRLALRNLIDNALRHGQASTASSPAEPAAVTVTVRLQAGAAASDGTPGHMAAAAGRPQAPTAAPLARPGVLISVRDHGPGVTVEQLGRLGQAFWRADSARQRRTGGVGLGLYLVRLVVEAHGGRLHFSHADPGLRADIWLPLAPLALTSRVPCGTVPPWP